MKISDQGIRPFRELLGLGNKLAVIANDRLRELVG